MKKRMFIVGLLAALAVLVVAGAGIALAQAPTPVPAGTAYVGVSLTDLDQRTATRLHLTQTTGVVIVGVVPGSPAKTAGLKVADVVTSVDGKAVTKASEAVAAVQAKKAGDTIAFVITRAGQSQTISAKSVETPQPANAGRGLLGKMPDLGWGGRGSFGFGGLPGLQDLQNLNPEQRFKQFLGQQFRYLNKDGQAVSVETVYGTVVSATKDSVTVQPNEKGKAQVTYAITTDTKVMLPGGATPDRLKAGDPVVVRTADGKVLSISGGFGFPTEQKDKLQKQLPNGRGGFPDGRGGLPGRAPNPGMVPKSGT